VYTVYTRLNVASCLAAVIVYVKKLLFWTVFFIIIIIKTSYIHQGWVKNTPELYIFGCNSLLLLFYFIYFTLSISLLFQDCLRWFMPDVWSLKLWTQSVKIIIRSAFEVLYLCLMLIYTYNIYYIVFYTNTHDTHVRRYIIITVRIIIVEIRHLLSTAAARCGKPSTLGGLSNARLS